MAFGSVNVGGGGSGSEATGVAANISYDNKESKADATNVQEALDEVFDKIANLAFTIDTIPSQNGTLTYNGSVQSPTWNAFNPEALELGGVVQGTDAGSYIATFKPKEGYQWNDGTTEEKEVTWSINRATIAAVPSQNNTLTYTGTAQSPTWDGYDSAKMTIGGEQSATDAGNHVATFTPTKNYQWSDTTTNAKEVTWSIGRATIAAVPAQSGTLTYTGSAQSPSWSNYDAEKMTLGGSTSGTNAGTYQATFTPTSNYCWSGGGTGAKNVNWVIGKAAGSLSLNPQSLTLTNAIKTGSIIVTRAGDGAITAQSNANGVATVSVSGNTVTVTGVAFGTATITVKVAAGTNHNAPADKTCTVKVNIFNTTLNSNTWDAIKAASDTGNAASVWSVGDTKNIKINGKVGNFTFSNLSIDTFIVGFNHNSSLEGNSKIHFQIGKISNKLVGLCDGSYGSSVSGSGYFSMNTYRSNFGGWKSCYMRNTLLGNDTTPSSPTANSMLAALPPDLRAVMKPVTKYTDNTGAGESDNASYVTATTDYLFLLAEFEYHGARAYANSAEKNYQKQYDYYKAGNSKVHNRFENPESAVSAWTRSAHAGYGDNFCLVETNGSPSVTSADVSRALSPGFAV